MNIEPALSLASERRRHPHRGGPGRRPAALSPGRWSQGLAVPPSPRPTLAPLRTLGLLALGAGLLTACQAGPGPASAGVHEPAATPTGAPAPAAAAAPVADPADWCGGHGLPESKCTVCNPELTAGFKAAGDWCAAHGFPESACPQCNPMRPPSRGAPAPAAAAAPVADPADWCGGHGLPESKCTVCNPELTAGFKASGDWCAAHGFPESACPQCNPMRPPSRGAPDHADHDHADHADHADHDHADHAAPAPGRRVGDPADWCAEHGVPESLCTRCHPELADRFQAEGNWCGGHGFPESVCPQCNPMTPPTGVAGPNALALADGRLVSLASPELVAVVGVQTVPAVPATGAREIRGLAHVDWDRNAMAEVRSPVVGVIREALVDVGARVDAGTPLFRLEGAQIGALRAALATADAEVRAARAESARQRELADTGVGLPRALDEARRALGAARAARRSAQSALDAVGATATGAAGTFVVNAPRAGTLVQRPVTVGSLAGPDVLLALLVDTDSAWVHVDIPESDAPLVRPGHDVSFWVHGLKGHVFGAPIQVVASQVEPHTRTVSARATVDNHAGWLRAGQFGEATVQVPGPAADAMVPRAALQRVGDGYVVFVQRGPASFEARAVEVGPGAGRFVPISGAVTPGDAIVVTGGFLLRTELDPDAIGAGCVHDHGSE